MHWHSWEWALYFCEHNEWVVDGRTGGLTTVWAASPSPTTMAGTINAFQLRFHMHLKWSGGEWRGAWMEGVDLGSGCTGLEAMCGNCEQLALVWWQCHKPQVLFAVKCSIHDSWGVGSICSPQNFGLRHSASYLCSSRTGLLLMKLYPWSAKCLARWPSSTKSPSILALSPTMFRYLHCVITSICIWILIFHFENGMWRMHITRLSQLVIVALIQIWMNLSKSLTNSILQLSTSFRTIT